MSEKKDTFKFSLRGKDSLASKWIEQKRSPSGSLKDDGANVFAIGDYIYEVFSISKLSDGKISKNNLYAKIRDINGLTNDSIVKFEDTIDIPFVHNVKKIPFEKGINFTSIAKKLGDEQINDNTLQVSDVLTADEIKIMAINYHHIQYDRRDKENIAGKTYDEIMSKPILYFSNENELSFIYPDYVTTQTKKVVESTEKETPIAVPLTENTIQPEITNTVVEGYFYKSSTGQADSKNKTYKGTSKKVYSVEEFKESYTTADCIDLDCEYDDFTYVSFVVMKECTTKNLNEYKAVAFTSKNHSKATNTSWKSLMASGYSSVKNKRNLLDSEKTAEANLARRAVIYVLEGHDDITDGAEYWDGTDFIAWGLETTPQGVKKHAKFRQYKFIEIPSSIFTAYKSNYASSIRYGEDGHTSALTHTPAETHTHKDGKIYYKIPADVFKNNLNSKGDFQYDTDYSTTYGLTATLSAGESIFWKLSTSKTL